MRKLGVAGLVAGALLVVAPAASADVRLSGGATSLKLDRGTAHALASLGVAVTTASFRISGGRVDLDLAGGTIRHTGGISLTKGSTVVRLEGFDIRLGAAPQLFASVNGSSKVAILDLDLSGATPTVSGRRITVPGVTAALTQGAADALNAAFGTTAFTAGLVLGTATVDARGR